jgi:hypothetical protein
MSAFIIQPATMDRVVYAWGEFHRLRECAQLDEIGKRLFRMNADAVAARYREQPDYTDAEEYRFSPFSLMNSPLIHQIKAVDCLMYQCSEGNVPERDDYKALIALRSFLCGAFLRRLPEFEAAPWDTHKDTRRAPVVRIA